MPEVKSLWLLMAINGCCYYLSARINQIIKNDFVISILTCVDLQTWFPHVKEQYWGSPLLFSFTVIASPLGMQMGLPDALLFRHYKYADGSLRLLCWFFLKWSWLLKLCSLSVQFLYMLIHPPKPNLKLIHPGNSLGYHSTKLTFY